MKVVSACLFFVALVLLVPRAYAVVDQQYVPATTNQYANVGAGNVVDWAQTFTVEVTGTLIGVDLWIDRQAIVTQPLLFDIRTAQGGVPTEADAGGNILASAVLPAAMFLSSPGETGAPPAILPHIDLTSSPVPVHVGDVLAIALRSDDAGTDGDGRTYMWHGNQPGEYPNGSAFLRSGNNWGELNTREVDEIFRTYIIPVPEPASLLLTIACTMSLVLYRRKPPSRLASNL